MTKIKFLIKTNIIVFSIYLPIILSVSFFDFIVLPVLQVLLGVAIYFLAGANLTLLLEKLLKRDFDMWEHMTISALISLFFVPLAIFIFYELTGFLNFGYNLSIYLLITIASLVLSYFYESKNSRKI